MWGMRMPLRPVNREQAWLLPPILDDLLPADHSARFVAAFVDGLDRGAWKGRAQDSGPGRPERIKIIPDFQAQEARCR